MMTIEIIYKNGSLGDNFKPDTTLFFEAYDKNYNLIKFKARLEFGNFGYNVERINIDLMDEETFKKNCLDGHTLRNYEQGCVIFNYWIPRSFTELFRKGLLYYKLYKESSDMYDEYKEDIYDEYYKKVNYKKLLTKKLFGICDINKYRNCNNYNSGNESYLFFELENYRYCISLFYS